ncbi:MAG: hypothetical protein FWG93_06905 [Oscillospiraceae bacterium]|nr:hypothetical protein [Oscillospiraceae bacterium]
MKHMGISRTYTRLTKALGRLTPDTARVLRGGLRATLALEFCALILWFTAAPFRLEEYELWRSAQALCALIPATLAITLAGGAAVECAARKAGG